MNRRVVVWSDSPFVARTVSAGLSEGYDVTRVSPDASSVQNVAELQPDLVILDVPSDGPDAAALLHELWESEGTGRIQMLFLQGVFDGGSCSELPGFAPETRLFKPFLAEGLRDKVESLIKAGTEPGKRIPAVAPEVQVAPGPVTISDDELDEALSEALKELKAESLAQNVGDSGLGGMEWALDALEVEPDVIDDNQLDEGVGREESVELIEKGTLGRVETSTDEDELMEATAVTEDVESIGKGTMGDREFMDEMIDGLVDRVMERVSIELKASLKRSLNERMRQMARRAVQDLLPKLSERLIAEMFKSESEKQQ